MKKSIIIFIIFLFFACAPKFITHPIETKTKTGDAVTVITPKQIGSRQDVPVGWKPADTIIIKQQGKAETYVNKKTGEVAQNAPAQAITQSIETPKKSWAWAWWTGGILGVLVLINYLLNSFFGVNPFGWIGKKIFKGG